ncbi:diacylglycerol/lipid kinase family protein [Frigoriflavimonas asaccharolytica]|uniref:YegS/Rv2252/BmrU family lipid kinase n=1 Tax=Frigoriflavimonas asaccharolytica TaxID=2735899 RepID=A0A8J8G9S4_9FLAO|nr:diacylglycerol kinase family protein [Frigoriflavimonas asaccharolytica]NRS91885.1 YegS/Rv2252/BmrU family lipid kinase [Frigoriflavimonas asaccharolytica]
MKNVAFIINPFSAKKEYHSFVKLLEDKVENPLVSISKSIKDSQSFIKKNWDNVDIFVAVGGDGTISTIAKELINTDKILAAFPAGSGNGFARELNFTKDLDLLLQKIKVKKSIQIDTFTINERLSINVSGVGFDGAVVKDFEKTNRGLFNYAKISLKNYLSFKPIEVEFETKYKSFNGKYLMINLANTKQFGNNAFIAPKADYTDGILEIALVKKFPFYYFAKFGYQLFNKTLQSNKFLTYISTSEISFKINTQNWHLDGEYNQISSPVHIKIVPKSLRVLV